jgi:hypothetical protein
MSRNRVSTWIVAMAAVAVLAVGIKTVYAHCGHCLTDAKYFGSELEKSHMSLAKASEAAEKAAKGQAVHATVMRKKSGEGVNVEVHVLSDGKIQAVLVDGDNGKVLKKSPVKDLNDHAA